MNAKADVEGDLGDGRHAVAVDRPESVEALAETVARRIGEGHAIYPQGGRTALDYGGIPAKPGVAIALQGLNRVVDYPAADMTITVESGVTMKSLQDTLFAHGQRLPIDAPQADRATLGGVYATNTCGPRRFGWGRPRDWIIGVSFVTAAGEVVKGGGRVVKNVAGYDFPRLLTGSMGTLGILSQMTLKVRPIPETSAFAWACFDSNEAVDRALIVLNTSVTRAAAIELLNRPSAEAIGGPLGLPSVAWVLAIGYEGPGETVSWQLDRVVGELASTRCELRIGVDAEPLWSVLNEFSAKTVPGAVSIVANIRRSAVVRFASKFDPENWSIQAHAGNGIVRGQRIVAGEFDPMTHELESLRRFAIEASGNMIIARCPSEWKQRLAIWGVERDDWLLGKRIKDALDPKGMMNPGRFVGRM